MVSLRMFGDRGLVVAVMSNLSYAKTSTLALRGAAGFVNGPFGR